MKSREILRISTCALCKVSGGASMALRGHRKVTTEGKRNEVQRATTPFEARHSPLGPAQYLYTGSFSV